MSKVCFVALSGGVDSAATALVLKEQGYDVKGVILRLKPGDLANKDIEDAQKVANHLNIPLTVLDRRKEFKKITEKMKFEAETLGEFYQEWTKYEALYKLGKNIEYGSIANFDLDDYTLTAVSEDPCEEYEIFYQSEN